MRGMMRKFPSQFAARLGKTPEVATGVLNAFPRPAFRHFSSGGDTFTLPSGNGPPGQEQRAIVESDNAFQDNLYRKEETWKRRCAQAEEKPGHRCHQNGEVGVHSEDGDRGITGCRVASLVRLAGLEI